MMVLSPFPLKPRGLVFTSLLVSLAGASFAAGPSEDIAWSNKLDAGAGVTTVAVQAQGDGAGIIFLQGTVVLPAQRTEVVSMPVAGVVQTVLVAPMQSVRAGQPVARIMSPQLVEWQREWLMAESQARLAQGKAQRDEQMFVDGIVSEHRRNESRAQYEMATLTAHERRQTLRLAGVSDAALAKALSTSALSPLLTLTAPVTGTVLEQNVMPGQRLEAGSLVVRMGRSGRLAIDLQVSAQLAPTLRVGDRLAVEGCKQPGRVVAISNQVSSATQSVMLRAELTGEEDCLRINQFVRVRTQGQGTRAGETTALLRVPAQAVVQHGGREYVFVRTPDGFRATAVTTGVGGGSDTPIMAGLKAGEQVAVKGVAAIKGAWLGLGPETAMTPATAAEK